MTYYLGIGMAVTLFTLLLISVVPMLVQYSYLGDLVARTDGEFLEMFAAHPAYSAMYERFPDASEELEAHGRGDGSLRVGAMDFESGTQLILYLHMHRDIVSARVECMSGNEDSRMFVDGLFAVEYIRTTDCLEPAG